MAIRRIVERGDPILSKKCRAVSDFNARIHTLLDDMVDTLEEAEGVGLAAPQVGILRRVCVVMDEDWNPIELINPSIVHTEGEQSGLEGCLSIPGRYGVVVRPYRVRVHAQDRFGLPFEVTGEKLLARCLCHEIEHLDGHLYTERCDHLLSDEEVDQYMKDHPDEFEERDQKKRKKK